MTSRATTFEESVEGRDVVSDRPGVLETHLAASHTIRERALEREHAVGAASLQCMRNLRRLRLADHGGDRMIHS